MLVEISEMSKVYPHDVRAVSALTGVSLAFDAGEFVAVCGPSGCGKSTLLLALGGLLRPDAGEVRIAGINPYALGANARARFRAEQLGFVFQRFHLVPYLNVYDNVVSSRIGVQKADRYKDSCGRRALDLIYELGLGERQYHRPHELSVGERQRVALARAMLNRPRLLLADEPTGNLDRANADLVFGYLQRFREQGGAVLLVTHDPSAAGRADKIIQMADGRVVD